MPKIAIVTDSSTAITPEEAKALGIFVAPLAVFIDGKDYMDFVNVQPTDIVEALKARKDIKTSQPNVGALDELFQKLKAEKYDHIIAISISSALSGTFQSFRLAASSNEIDNFTLIDTLSAASPLRHTAKEAKKMADAGKSVDEIVAFVEKVVKDSMTYILPDSLDQLIHGGRVKGATAVLGQLLKIKLCLKIEYNVPAIEKFDTARTDVKLFQAIVEDFGKRNFKPATHKVYLPQCESMARVEAFKAYLDDKIPGFEYEVIALPAGIAAHTGFAFGVQPVLKA